MSKSGLGFFQAATPTPAPTPAATTGVGSGFDQFLPSGIESVIQNDKYPSLEPITFDEIFSLDAQTRLADIFSRAGLDWDAFSTTRRSRYATPAPATPTPDTPDPNQPPPVDPITGYSREFQNYLNMEG